MFSISTKLLSVVPLQENWFKQNLEKSRDIWGDRLIDDILSPRPLTKVALNLTLGKKATKWMRKQMDFDKLELLIPNAVLLKKTYQYEQRS